MENSSANLIAVGLIGLYSFFILLFNKSSQKLKMAPVKSKKSKREDRASSEKSEN